MSFTPLQCSQKKRGASLVPTSSSDISMGSKDVVDIKLEEIGGYGRYQLLHTLIINVTCRCAYLWQITAIVFTGYYNEHHCTVPANTTKDEWIPKITGPDGDIMYDQCHHYTEIGSNETVTCEHGWTYDPGTFHPTTGTIVMEWDLVCTKSNLVEISIVCANVGCFLGTVIASPLGDRYGRRKTFFAFLIFLIISGTANAFSPDIITFCVLSFIKGVGVTGVFTQGSVLSIELVPKRVIPISVPLSIMIASGSQMLIALLAFIIPQWKYLQITISLIPVLSLPYYWWCPESFHWLYQKHRYEELDKDFLRVAEFNKRPAPTSVARPLEDIVYVVPPDLAMPLCEGAVCSKTPDAMADVACNSNHSNNTTCSSLSSTASTRTSNFITSNIFNSDTAMSENDKINNTTTAGDKSELGEEKGAAKVNPLSDFLLRPRTLTYLLVLCYLAFVSYSSYFGLVYLQGSLTGSVYLNIALNGLLGVPGILVSMVLLRRFGRRPSQAATFAFLGVMMMMSAASEYITVPGGNDGLLSTVFAMIAKGGQSASYSIFNFYGLEIIPTNIRSTVMGIMTGLGYMGGIVSPFISISLIRIQFWIPGVVYGIIILIAAGLTLLLPETRGRDLPTTAAEVEAWPTNLTQAEKLRLKEGRLYREKFAKPSYDNAAAVFEDTGEKGSLENGGVITQF